MARKDPQQPDSEEQAAVDAAPAGDSAAPQQSADGTADDNVGAGPATELSAEEQLLQLHEEVAEARDAVLRARAEAQNASRRAEQDVERARKFALERFAGELLPVVDNLERALEAAVASDEAAKPIVEGVELTLKSFQDVLAKFNIAAVDPQSEPFDPNLHQAMSMVENNNVEPNTVIAVMQKGYTLNGRLVRPAMVMVSKGSS